MRVHYCWHSTQLLVLCLLCYHNWVLYIIMYIIVTTRTVLASKLKLKATHMILYEHSYTIQKHLSDKIKNVMHITNQISYKTIPNQA